ncbi:hypothetical protein ACLQ2S_05265 [Micromonospora sp. DT48]|uniref:hypothetical protein n=1 Tax=Micromonospora sp. DT48 TaxID=3393429 RepID=UPI003CEB39B0
MSGEQGIGSVEVADLPEIEVDSKPELLVLVAENDIPIGWAIVLPEGDFWLIRVRPVLDPRVESGDADDLLGLRHQLRRGATQAGRASVRRCQRLSFMPSWLATKPSPR